MKQSVILLLTLLVYLQIGLAQNKSKDNFLAVDKKSFQMPDDLTRSTDQMAGYFNANFKTDKEKARAIYVWIASHIQYDLEQLRHHHAEMSDTDRITKTLQFRKGVCANYASLFRELCTKSDIKCFTISGYTRQNDRIVNIPHAWNAASIDGIWYLFDTTWGGGYVSNGKYIHQLNYAYFMVRPSTLINTHMPFDYLWQFLNYPVSHQDFTKGKTTIHKSNSYFNFNDSIGAYEKLNRLDQLRDIEHRISKENQMNMPLSTYLDEVRQERTIIKHNRQVALYNSASRDYVDGMNRYNEYISYWNAQFNPMKSDNEIKKMIDTADYQLQISSSKLDQTDSNDSELRNPILQLRKSIASGIKLINDQQEWLKMYLSKSKLKRKAMFMGKITWFGVPLN